MTAPHPTATPADARRRGGGSWSLPLVLGGVALGGAVTLALRSPHVAGSYGFCPSALLGLACPGCGGLRGTYELVHGDVAAAWSYNPLVVLGAPVLLVLLARWFRDAVRGEVPWSPPTWAAVTVAVGLGVFWVLRNVPALSAHLGPLAIP